MRQNAQDWELYYKAAKKIGKKVYKAYSRKRGSSPPRHSAKSRRRTANNQSTDFNVIRQQAGKSTRKIYGSKKTKGIVHRKRSVKVSRQLRKKIKKVMAGAEIKGTFTNTRQGTIGFAATSAAAIEYRQITRAGGYPFSVVSLKLPKVSGANVRFLWSQPYGPKDAFDLGDDWQFFTPMKILDAASVLWNQKTINQDYTNQVGNLNTRRSFTTGTPIIGTPADPGINGLKIHVMNAYVTMTIKNNTQRSMNIVVYKCVPTTKFPDVLALEAFHDAAQEEVDATNTGLCAIQGPLASDIDNIMITPGIEPNEFKSFRSSWKYTKVKINLSAGETTTCNFQGPKNYVLDYDKLKQGDQDVSGFAYKQTTMNLIMSVSPDLEFGTNTDNAFNQVTGRWWQTELAAGGITNPISIEWKETFRLACPDIVGFQSGPAGIGGNKQTLNLRIPRRAYGNFCDVSDNSVAPTYTAHNEDNVAVPMDQSIYE